MTATTAPPTRLPTSRKSASNNDPDNDWARTVLVEDTSKDYDVVSVGAIYSDGPMAVSIGWIASDYGNGDESSATMLSVGYTLAPGVSSKTLDLPGRRHQGRLDGRRHGLRDRHRHRLLSRCNQT